MRAIFVDAANEIAEIAREVSHLRAALERWQNAPLPDGSQAEWEATHICASATEKIYTGCERVMALLASELDDAPVPHSEDWHALLLRRLANPYPGVREAVLSDDAYKRLDRLRAFRHRERNSYGIHLDPDIVRERGREALTAFEVFRHDVEAFAAQHGA